MSFDYRYPTPLPDTKGWGPGWPACQQAKIVPHDLFRFGVRTEILELCNLLVAELQRKGYVFTPGWSWGFGCRSTKGGSGDVPSFHSWGLALDFNAPENVFGSPESSSDLATKNRWVVGLMKEYGFFWLGPDIKDWMHFSFCGSPADAKAMTLKARRDLGDDDMGYREFKEGVKMYQQGKPEPAGPGDEMFGYQFARNAHTRPAPGAHEHADLAKKAHSHIVTGTAS